MSTAAMPTEKPRAEDFLGIDRILTDEERDILAILKSYQHPDHDTDRWTPGEGE